MKTAWEAPARTADNSADEVWIGCHDVPSVAAKLPPGVIDYTLRRPEPGTDAERAFRAFEAYWAD